MRACLQQDSTPETPSEEEEEKEDGGGVDEELDPANQVCEHVYTCWLTDG